MDQVLGTSGLETYRSQAERIAREVLESDPVGEAVAKLAERQAEWEGTASKLLEVLSPADPPRGWPPRSWPKTARGLAGVLRRAIPALREVGVEVILPAPTDKGRVYVVRRFSPV